MPPWAVLFPSGPYTGAKHAAPHSALYGVMYTQTPFTNARGPAPAAPRRAVGGPNHVLTPFFGVADRPVSPVFWCCGTGALFHRPFYHRAHQRNSCARFSRAPAQILHFPYPIRACDTAAATARTGCLRCSSRDPSPFTDSHSPGTEMQRRLVMATAATANIQSHEVARYPSPRAGSPVIRRKMGQAENSHCQ